MKVPEISQLYDIVWPEPHSGRFDPGPYPEHGEIYATYTGQFVVSRDRIRAHSKEKWAHVRAILESERESPIHIGGPPGWGYKVSPKERGLEHVLTRSLGGRERQKGERRRLTVRLTRLTPSFWTAPTTPTLVTSSNGHG